MKRNPERSPSSEPLPDVPRIYVASLADYNAGALHGAWIDATLEIDDMDAYIHRMLAASPTTPNAEEYAVHDYQAFGAYAVGEYDPMTWIHAIAVGIAEHGYAFAAWAALCDHDDEQLERFTDTYLGDYQSAAAYAEQLFDDIGLQGIIDEHVPDRSSPTSPSTRTHSHATSDSAATSPSLSTNTVSGSSTRTANAQ